jgi:hypothetical protein
MFARAVGEVMTFTPLVPLPGYNSRFAMVPAHLIIHPGVHLSIEADAQVLYVRSTRGEWERIHPSAQCSGKGLFILRPHDLYAVLYASSGNPLPPSVTVAKVPLGHRQRLECHATLGAKP